VAVPSLATKEKKLEFRIEGEINHASDAPNLLPLSAHSGHGWAGCRFDPVAFDPKRTSFCGHGESALAFRTKARLRREMKTTWSNI